LLFLLAEALVCFYDRPAKCAIIM
jgi:hypothetical protein